MDFRMHRIYQCNSAEEITHRTHLLTMALGCHAASSCWVPLTVEDLPHALELDSRFTQSEADLKYLTSLLDEGHSLGLFEIWCPYWQGQCPVQKACGCRHESSRSLVRL